MTDLEFLEQLKRLLLNFEQILVRNDVKEIQTSLREIQQFMVESHQHPPVKSGVELRALAEEVNEVMIRNQVLLREGLLITEVFMRDLVDRTPNTTGNYNRSHLSADAPPHTPSQRIFDARV